MRAVVAAGLAVSLLALAGCSSKPAQWKVYDYPAWGFGVSFKTPPTVTETPASAQSTHSFQAEAQQGEIDLVVIAEDSQAAGKTDAQILADIPDEMVSAAQGTYKSSGNVTVGKAAGRDLVIDRGANPTEHARVFVVNGRVYQVITQTPPGDDPADANKFLESFHFLAK